MLFWTSGSQDDDKVKALRSAEAQLMAFAKNYGRDGGKYKMELVDTEISASVLPLQEQPDVDATLVMHGVRVSNLDNTDNTQRSKIPLVLTHGYMNGALYFYRNIVGLSNSFQTVFSLDLMGWGLSSRPEFELKDDSVETAEDFFVESLEAWRAKNKIEKMTLAGHSMGGYLSVAYCERYPHRVESLILLSPVGVPEPDEAESNRRYERVTGSLLRRTLFAMYLYLYDMAFTPAKALRTVPESQGRNWISNYVENRLPSVSRKEERSALKAYLYSNNVLPGSGEYCLNRLLCPHAFAKKPTVHRIPQLQIQRVSFLYGENDWMDFTGGREVHTACHSRLDEGLSAPDIDVYRVKDAGHLLMLENWEETNSAVAIAAGAKESLPQGAPLPMKVGAKTVKKEIFEALLVEESNQQSVQVQV